MTNSASIVIPTFNRAAMLPRAIDSALAQSVACEVIVVDHGSTDETPSVAEAYGDRIRYIRRDSDFGPHFCWLDGVLHSSGDLLHLQFDDDWIEPAFIESCQRVMTPRTGFAFSAASVVADNSTKPPQVIFQGWLPATGTYPVGKVEKRFMKTVISPACCLYRRDTVIDALYQGHLPLSSHHYHGVGPDLFMSLLSMLRYPEVGFVREPLANFQAHDGSISIDAEKDQVKAKAIRSAYDETRRFYSELKALRRWRSVWR